MMGHFVVDEVDEIEYHLYSHFPVAAFVAVV